MFKLSKTGSAYTPVTEFIMGTADEAISLGETLKLSSGKLTKASGTDMPEFISVGSGTGVVIPVIRILDDMEFETVFQASNSDVVIGDFVTIHTDGLQITATESSGVFEVLYKGGNAAGDIARGCFKK